MNKGYLGKMICLLIVMLAFVACQSDEGLELEVETAVAVIEENVDVSASPTVDVAPTEVVEIAEEDATAETMIQVRFIESAPKDKFVIANIGECGIAESIVVIDLAETAGALIFDTTSEGAGVEVFQPFEITDGDLELATQADVSDGESQLTLRMGSLPPGEIAGFTIDVDDTLTNSELGMIRVTDSEMSGGIVSVSSESQPVVETVFEENNVATLQLSCAAL